MQSSWSFRVCCILKIHWNIIICYLSTVELNFHGIFECRILWVTLIRPCRFYADTIKLCQVHAIIGTSEQTVYPIICNTDIVRSNLPNCSKMDFWVLKNKLHRKNVCCLHSFWPRTVLQVLHLWDQEFSVLNDTFHKLLSHQYTAVYFRPFFNNKPVFHNLSIIYRINSLPYNF